MNCSDPQLVVAIWDLPVTDVVGFNISIPFYITPGDGPLLLGNEVVHQSRLLGPENLLVIPPGVRRLASKEITLQTYCEPMTISDPHSVRTYLFVVPAKSSSLKVFFSSKRAYFASKKDDISFTKKFSEGRAAKRLAVKLHGYTHLPLEDMVTVYTKRGVMNPVLRHALKQVVLKCTSCKSTGRPLNARKISFGKILAQFNEHVQVDFFFVDELDNDPIFHMVDVHTGLSATALGVSRKMDETSREFEKQWVNIHGPPAIVSADLEFFNATFTNALRYFGVQIQPKPARRHNKQGVVERKNTSIRLLCQRILKDAQYFSLNLGNAYDKNEILPRATYLSNILYGSKILSSFEMARGYTPSISGLPQCQLTESLIQAHEEQVSRRALKKLDKSKNPHTIDPCVLQRNQMVYYFKRGAKFGKWLIGFVRIAEPHFVSISSRKDHQGKPIRAAYEDIRLIPSSSLLQDMDKAEFLFPRSYSVVDEDFELQQDESVPLPDLFPELQQPNSTEQTQLLLPRDESPHQHDDTPQNVGISHDRGQEFDNCDELTDLQLDTTQDVGDMIEQEASLWSKRMSFLHSFVSTKRTRLDFPSMDIGVKMMNKLSSMFASKSITPSATPSVPINDTNSLDITQPHDPPLPSKDVGDVPIQPPHILPTALTSSEQEILRRLKDVVGCKPTTEFHLQSAPRWVLDKSINAEKRTYEGAYEEVDFKSLPRDANLISSHHFFQIKDDGQEGKLKLKCRLVRHGNKDKDKDSVRKDSATAQFPIIRIVLSVAAILHMSIASIDIKGAYLQSGYISRDIYMRPPKGWASSSRKVWKLLKPAYGIVESGRLWQLVVEEWMSGEGLQQIPGLPQLFVKYNKDGNILLAIAKVVDDFLIVGHQEDIHSFHRSISQRFEVGRFIVGPNLIFNRLHITQSEDYSIRIDMREYLDTIKPIDLDRYRRKQQKDRCTPTELKAYQGLAGSLNFLGHGVLPQASFAASTLQQSVSRLTVEGLVTANKVLQEIKSLNPFITFPASQSLSSNPSYLAFSDASHSTTYGQTGYISGIYLPAGGGTKAIYHVLDWVSCKQSRVSFSSAGAEILAAATSTDRGSLMAECLQAFYASPIPLPFVLSVDSNGLYSTVTTLHEGADYRLRPTVARIRDSYETGESAVMQWIPGPDNLADGLTKRNLESYRSLNNVMCTGILDYTRFRVGKRVRFTI